MVELNDVGRLVDMLCLVRRWYESDVQYLSYGHGWRCSTTYETKLYMDTEDVVWRRADQ